MTKNFIFAGFLFVLMTAGLFAQTPTPTLAPMPTLTPAPDLETILSETHKQNQNYREEFKNLLADEKKTFETYDKNSGTVKKTTVVDSTLLVYQSPKNKNVASELRNILKVDGNSLPDSQKRSDQLLAELQKTTTLEKELEKIQSEGARYDKTLEISGLTVAEGAVLAENLRPYFNFKLEGTENYQGTDVYVVSYQQTKKSPYILVNQNNQNLTEPGYIFKNISLPGSLKNEEALLRGKLWIDTQTYQLRREERELTTQAASPVVLLATTLDYQPSDYQILVPKEITLTSNQLKKKGNQYEAVKETKVTFDYSKFRKTETDVKILDDNE